MSTRKRIVDLIQTPHQSSSSHPLSLLLRVPQGRQRLWSPRAHGMMAFSLTESFWEVISNPRPL